MMQIEFYINSLAFKIQCNLHFGFASLCFVCILCFPYCVLCNMLRRFPSEVRAIATVILQKLTMSHRAHSQSFTNKMAAMRTGVLRNLLGLFSYPTDLYPTKCIDEIFTNLEFTRTPWEIQYSPK